MNLSYSVVEVTGTFWLKCNCNCAVSETEHSISHMFLSLIKVGRHRSAGPSHTTDTKDKGV